jgi:hypothetical protein
MSYYSIVDAVGTGVAQLISVPPYISKAHIKVTVAGTETTAFSWVNSGTISLTAPLGASIRVSRSSSPTTRLVSYGDGTSLPGPVLDIDSQQAFYLAQESFDRYVQVTGDLLYASFVADGVGASPRPTSAKLKDVISAEDFGAVGDGVTDDAPAIQAAVNFAASLINSSAIDGSSGVAIYTPGRGKKYLLGSTVSIPKHGIRFQSDAGRGACFIGDNVLFDVGDRTNASTVRDVSFSNIYFASTNNANTTAAVTLYRAVAVDFDRCVFSNFDIHIDGARISVGRFNKCWHLNTKRTANATAFIRLQGTDETAFASPSSYTPGGGIHIVDMEGQGARVSGGVETNYTGAGILVHSADGLYGMNIHMTGCKSSVELRPLATAANRVILDIYFTQCYWDEPSVAAGAAQARNVLIAGDVSPSIPCASGATTSSVYQNIRFTSCFGRGSTSLVQRCVEIKIGDAGGAFKASGGLVRDFQFNGGAYRNATITAIQAHGPSTGAYYPVYGLTIHGVYFSDNSAAGSSGVGSAIQAHAMSASVFGNTCGADAGATDYIFAFVLDAGSGASLSVHANNFAGSTPQIRDIFYSSVAGVRVSIADNVPSVRASQSVDQVFTLTTTDASTVPAWSYVIPSGCAGMATVDVVGASPDGSKAVTYKFFTGYRRNATTSSLSSGTSSWTTERAWNPDSFATIPAGVLSTHTLQINVTGIAATTINWTVRVRLQQCN